MPLSELTRRLFGHHKEIIDPNLFVVKLSPGEYRAGFTGMFEVVTHRVQRLGKTVKFEELLTSPTKLSSQTDILVDPQYNYSTAADLPQIDKWVKSRNKLLKDHPGLVLVVHTAIDPTQAESATSRLKESFDQHDRVRVLPYRCTDFEMLDAIVPGTMAETFVPGSASFSTHDVRAAAEAQKNNQT